MNSIASTQAEATHRARLNRRDEAERVLMLSRHLRRPEYRRAMVLRYREGWSIPAIATDLGIDVYEAKRMFARLKDLVNSREFLLMAVGSDQVPLRLHLMGECLYLNAMTMREAADATGQSFHQVRAAKREIEGIAVGAMGSNVPSYRGRRNIPGKLGVEA